MALDPLIPTVDTTLTAQVRQHETQEPVKGVLGSMANPSAKALQAEINSLGYLHNPAYTRP